jgi:hypothetical protein
MRRWPIKHDADLHLIHSDANVRDYVTQDTPACAGFGEGSNHLGSYVHSVVAFPCIFVRGCFQDFFLKLLIPWGRRGGSPLGSTEFQIWGQAPVRPESIIGIELRR